MSDALNIAVNGLHVAASRIAKTASSIVNASSTAPNQDLSSNLVAIVQEKNNYESDAAIVRAVKQTNKALLDIFA